MYSLWRYLLFGSDELTMPRDWLDGPRIRHYEAYTRRQLQQGCVVSDVAAMRRRAFWKAQEAKPRTTLKVVVGGRFQ